MKIKHFVAREFQYFEFGIFYFNSYIYYLKGSFIASTQGFNLLTCAFSLATLGFLFLTSGFELVFRGFELVTSVLFFHAFSEFLIFSFISWCSRNKLFTEGNSSWLIYELFKTLVIKRLTVLNLVFAKKTIYHAFSSFSW